LIRRFQLGAGEGRGYWMVFGLLLLAVLIPTGCLLYFINEAVGSQRNLAHQRLDDAYRGQLRLVSERIDSFWEQRARDLDARTDGDLPSVFFEHCVRDHLADSVICLDHNGQPAYPSLPAVPQFAAVTPRWVEAQRLEDSGRAEEAARQYQEIATAEHDPSLAGRARQAAIRCLVTAGKKEEAIRAIEAQFPAFHLTYATGVDGRVLLADELLLEIQLLPAEERGEPERRLFGIVQNYQRQMPSAQRLFLMDWLRTLQTEARFRTFPTYSAERMAERVLSGGLTTPGRTTLELSGLGDLWKLTSPEKRTIAFYQTDTVIGAMRQLVRMAHNPAFTITAPGRVVPPGQESMPAASRLPGWQISVPVPDAGGGLLADRRVASYLWIGFLTVAVVAILAVVGGQILRQQMRIANLKTDLVAAVSHELKTPLASMKLLVESLLGGEEFEPKRTRQYLQLVARENSRLSRLIDNFLTFSRMERNRGRFAFARVQPDVVARGALEAIGDRYAVELHVEPGLPPLYADEDALITVLLNLLDNAYKYTGDNRQIELNVFQSGGFVKFAVKDNGIGIAGREQKKIFRRFYQVDRSLSRQAGGVGLGLSIVEFVAQAHHGTVSVASAPGVGSTFTVSLPPSSSAAEAAA
jgi:signal transduction histidine kinase